MSISQLLRERVEKELRENYTQEMRRIEALTGKSLLVILAPNRWSKDIEQELHIRQSTVSMWRKRLGIKVDRVKKAAK